jgi:hypothetical protein
MLVGQLSGEGFWVSLNAGMFSEWVIPALGSLKHGGGQFGSDVGEIRVASFPEMTP